MKKINLSIAICAYTTTFVVLSTTGCSTSMQSIIEGCDSSLRRYTEVSSCIKNTYSEKSNKSHSISVNAFFAGLAVIDDEYRSHQISDDQAKVKMYQDYSKTIQLELDRRQASKPVVCMQMPFNRTVICQ